MSVETTEIPVVETTETVETPVVETPETTETPVVKKDNNRKTYLEIMQEGGKKEWEKAKKHSDKAVYLLAADKKINEKARSVVKDVAIAIGIQVVADMIGLGGTAGKVADIASVAFVAKAGITTTGIVSDIKKKEVTQQEIDDFFVM
jgi:hypothetical protein